MGMTVDVARGRARRGKNIATEQISQIAAIGEADANIFSCPRCKRPLAVGISRCTGCGLRMVGGVPLMRVAGFVAAGLVLGLLVGGGAVVAVTALSRPVDKPLAQAPANVTPAAPSTAPVAPTAAAPAVNPGIPASAVSALRQSTILNQRLLADADKLAAALRAGSPSGAEIAPLLRTMASTASFGDRLAPAVADWSDGAAVSQGLTTLYAAVGRVAEDGLSASVQNGRAYADAGKRMLAVLSQITELDAASRALAASADLELPPLVSDSP
jgi:ribosomal protein L37AE/L43A